MYISQTHSTNSYLKEHYSDSLPHLYSVRSDYQTAGRGQAGNTWESANGENLLISTLLRVRMEANRQFVLSIMVSLAVMRTVEYYLPQTNVSIKWPNDIYVVDKKIAGILLEHTLCGRYVEWSVAGVGLNVNQPRFCSSAPNPISMYNISGQMMDIKQVELTYMNYLAHYLEQDAETLRAEYMAHLYRKDGWHSYVEREVDSQPTTIAQGEQSHSFKATIADITREGLLRLRLENGEIKAYHFKQIRFVI